MATWHSLITEEMEARAKKMREFSQRPEIVELNAQLNAGLIHPIEYSCKVLEEAGWAGLFTMS